ncbi:MAG: hypothetical protein AAF639_35300 [Chloroflexota bacterium]
MQTATQPELVNIFQSIPLQEQMTSLRFLTNDDGEKTDVVVPMATWELLLSWLEDIEDRVIVQAWAPKLAEHPEKSGALKWEDIADDWLEDEDEA